MSLKKNLDIVIYEKMYEEIICGKWEPGQVLSPDEFVSHYGVSRTPVVQALKRMLTLDMISVLPAGHFYVPTYTKKQVEDLLEVRGLLERQVILDIERQEQKADLNAMKKLADSCAALNTACEVVKTRKADLEFHRFMVSQAHNQYLSKLYEEIQGQFVVVNYLLAEHTPTQQQVASDDHIKLVKALEQEDYQRACSIIDLHINGARDKILDKMNLSKAYTA